MLRQKTIKFASQVLAKTPIVRALDRKNGRRGGVILVFHEIAADLLSTHLNILADTYRFVSLDEFVARLTEGKSTVGLAAITFDDGVGSVTEGAAKVAIAHGWPITFYLPTRYLDTKEPYWFLELDLLLHRATGAKLALGREVFSLATSDSIAATSKSLRGSFKALATRDEVEALLRKIRYSLFGSESRPAGLSTPEPISWDRVRELAAHEEISFQAHTVNHLAVSRLSEEGLRKELEGCRSRIEELTGRSVDHFCYPYGSPNEVGVSAPNVVRKLFRSATTTTRGRCHQGVDLALLPRVPIDDRDSEEVMALKVGTAR
jgi:peptidoglycan/xylan/chitin deacetylase (PgdA/CDA1 family)